MAEQTIAERQAELEQWYHEWLNSSWERTPEGLLLYLKARTCMVCHGEGA